MMFVSHACSSYYWDCSRFVVAVVAVAAGVVAVVAATGRIGCRRCADVCNACNRFELESRKWLELGCSFCLLIFFFRALFIFSALFFFVAVVGGRRPASAFSSALKLAFAACMRWYSCATQTAMAALISAKVDDDDPWPGRASAAARARVSIARGCAWISSQSKTNV